MPVDSRLSYPIGGISGPQQAMNVKRRDPLNTKKNSMGAKELLSGLKSVKQADINLVWPCAAIRKGSFRNKAAAFFHLFNERINFLRRQ